MSAANNVMPATAKAETSLALSLAKTRDSLTEISPLLKQVKDVLDSNVLKTVMGCYGDADAAALGHMTLRNRHQRIANRLAQERDLDRHIAELTMLAPEGSREVLKDNLWFHIQGFVERYDAEVFAEVKGRFGEAISYIDPAARFAVIDSYVLKAGQEVLSAIQQWDAMQGSASSGRVSYAKARDDVVTAFTNKVSKLTDTFTSKKMLEDTLEMVSQDSQYMLQRAQYDLSLLSVERISAIDQKRKFLQDQIRTIDAQLTNVQGSHEKRVYVPLKVPRELVECLQGQELQVAMDSFMELNSHKYYVIPTYISRVGGDMDPVKGLFWRCPDAADGYLGVPEAFRERYREESRNLWMELIGSQYITSAVVRGITTPFNIGLAGDMVGQVALWDGVSAYWGLLSRYRPLDDQYRIDVEQFIDDAHAGYRKVDRRLLDHIQAIMKRVTEAKLLGIRIKWHKTGAKWVSMLSTRANYAVALQDYLKAPEDPDDCVRVLEQLLRVIEATAVREFMTADINTPFYANRAEEAWSGEDGDGAWQYGVPNPEHLQAMYMQAGAEDYEEAYAMGWSPSYAGNRGGKGYRGKGSSTKGDSSVVWGTRLRMAQQQAKGSSTYGKGKGGHGRGSSYWQDRDMRWRSQDGGTAYAVQNTTTPWNKDSGCYGKDCPGKRYQKFELCLTCHKTGMERGQVISRDNKIFPLSPTSGTTVEVRRAQMAAILNAGQAYRQCFAGVTMMSDDDAAVPQDMRQVIDDLLEMDRAGHEQGAAYQAYSHPTSEGDDHRVHAKPEPVSVSPKRELPDEAYQQAKKVCMEARNHENALIAALRKVGQHTK